MTISTDDLILERDDVAKRYLLTAKTSRGQDFLDEVATESSEWWGKSLIVRWRDVHATLDLIESKGLSVLSEYEEE